ncbi:MAG: TIGR03986 family CRISPR-associated RAMP protein, partial [Anaerolineae bacterium]
MAPKHKNPSSDRRTAVAPYNFIPVPDWPLPASDKVDHSVYDHKRRLTGWIDVTLETRSPVYVRGPLSPAEHRQMEQEDSDDKKPHLEKLRNKPDFFHTGDPNAPAIPGSSLRGMLRTLAQILGYGKLAPVSDAPLVYRAVADMSSHGDAYRARLMEEEPGQKNHYIPRIKGGYMWYDDNGDWYIRPAQEWGGVTYARLSRRNIPRKLKNWRNCRNASIVYIEPGPYEFQKVRGGFIHIKYANVLRVMADDAPGLRMAVLAQSGKMFKKNSEAVIFAPDENAALIRAPDELVTAYRDQISPEQERLLGKNGVLRQDQPIFYLLEGGKLTFFGHTRMFRMPYPHSPREMLSMAHRDDKLTDYAEAIFGSAKGEDTGTAGRVYVSDAQMVTGQKSPWLSDDPILIPEILSGPKPTTFQHYLTQSNPDAPKGQGLHTYNDDSRKTTLRGFKMYWHKGDASRHQIAEKGKIDLQKDTQHTKMKPVRSGVEFKFRVYYENLLLAELGLLWWTMALPANGDYCHKLGMGKPLGMGAVK